MLRALVAAMAEGADPGSDLYDDDLWRRDAP